MLQATIDTSARDGLLAAARAEERRAAAAWRRVRHIGDALHHLPDLRRPLERWRPEVLHGPAADALLLEVTNLADELRRLRGALVDAHADALATSRRAAARARELRRRAASLAATGG